MTDMFTRYDVRVWKPGEESLGTINKVKWTTHNRYKTIIGKNLRARTEEGREVEAKIACGILNQFLELGGAQSERIA